MIIDKELTYDSLLDYVLKGFTFQQICVIYKDFYESKPHLLFKLYHDIKVEIERNKK